MRELLLARHGESEYSARALANGDPGVRCPLTMTGRAQARALGELLRDEPIELCVVTEFERVEETADLALAGRDVPRLVVPELNDPRVGPFEGKALDEYRRWAWGRGPTEAPAGGEHRVALAERYARGFRLVLELPEETVLCVAHSLQGVRDAEHRLLGELEHEPETARVPLRERHPVLATRGRLRRAAAPGPAAVLVERLALERPHPRVVELRDDEARHVAPGEREVGRLLDALELRHDAQLDRLVAQQLAEGPCLRAPRHGERAANPGVAVRERAGAVLALAVTGEEEFPHRRTLR